MNNDKPYASAFICISILSYWIFIALHSGQAIYENQHSRLLLGYGAVDGRLLEQGDFWRILVSQFTHVKFPHMLGNVFFIYIIGSYIELRYGVTTLILTYLIGGLSGQYASVLFNPDLVSSGASQALCSLAGFLFIHFTNVFRNSRIIGLIVLLFIVIQCGLDLYFAGRLKEGHSFGFLTGAVMGLCFYWLTDKLKERN